MCFHHYININLFEIDKRLAYFDNLQLVLWCGAVENGNISNNALEFKNGHIVDLLSRKRDIAGLVQLQSSALILNITFSVSLIVAFN